MMEMENSDIPNRALYDCVKTDGKNFHCFLCAYNMFTVVDAELHIADEDHISKFSSPSYAARPTLVSSEDEPASSLHDRLKRNTVRLEDLQFWTVEGAELFDVDSDGEIFCLLCEDYVEITELSMHCADSSLHMDVKRAIVRLCDDVRTDGTLFYCFQCNYELTDSKRLKEHVVAPTHAFRYPEVRIGLLQNAFDSLFVQCEIKNLTADDLKDDRITVVSAFVDYLDVESDGKLYCLLCNRYLKFTVLSEHFDDDYDGAGSSHKKIIDNINNNLLKYVRTLRGNGGVYFYCFLCSCEIFSVNNVKLHVSSRNHAYRYLASQRPSSIFEFELELLLTRSQYDYDLLLFLDEREKFYAITKDDISRLLAQHKDDFFDIADGKIRCEPCSEEYASVIRFVTHCAGSDDHRIGNTVYHLCAEIKMIGYRLQNSIGNNNNSDNSDDNDIRYSFYCLKCSCRIGSRSNLKPHIFGKSHREQCLPNALVSKKTMIDQSYDFFVDRFQFKPITFDDLQHIVAPDDACLLQFLNVNVKGYVYCVLCGTFVNIFDEKKPHFNDDLDHKMYVSRVQTLREKIKLLSDDHEGVIFYCFVCFSKICGRECLTEHVMRKCVNRLQFKLMEFAYDWLIRERRIRFEQVTKDDLKYFIDDADETEFFELRLRSGNHCGRIYCSLCELDLDISVTREHCIKNWKHRKSVSAVRGLRDHVKIVGDDYLFCFLCPGAIGNADDVCEHVRSRHHSALQEQLVGLPKNAFDLAWTQERSKFRSVTRDDLKRLTSDPPELFDVRSDGTIYCSPCTDIVSMATLREHCQSTSHLAILSHVNDYLCGKSGVIVCDEGGHGKQYYYCRLCSCKIGASLVDLKEHIGAGGRHASVYHRSQNGHRLPDYVADDSFLRRLKFEHVVTSNGFVDQLNVVRQLCAEIRVDRSAHYYCICCHCPITNGRPIEHVTGNNHVSKCPNVPRISFKLAQNFLNDSSFPFETLSADDLPKILKANVDFFTVDSGQLYCQPCARPINLINAERHSLDLVTHKSFIIGRLCEDIRTIGINRFYCFRCSRSLLSFAVALEHAVGAQHSSHYLGVGGGRLKLIAVNAVADFKFKLVTREHLKQIVDDVRFLDVDPNNGEICCKDCDYISVAISELREHASTHTLAKDKAKTDLVENTYVPINNERRESSSNSSSSSNIGSSSSSIGSSSSSSSSSSSRIQLEEPMLMAGRNNVAAVGDLKLSKAGAADSRYFKTDGINLHGKDNDAFNLCESVITDYSKAFYCLRCSCALSGRQHAEKHIVGAKHLSVLKVAQNKFTSMRQLLGSFLPSYQFRMVTINHLPQILETNIDWFTVIEDTGRVHCQICEEFIPLVAVRNHAQRLSIHKNRHIKRVCDGIKASGDQFYCVRCSCLLSGIGNAISHAISDQHVKCHYTPPKLYPADFKFEHVTKEQLNGMAVERFDVEDDLDRLCEVMNCFEQFYCLSCPCAVSRRGLLTHITGVMHLTRLGIAKDHFKAVQERLRSSFSLRQFRNFTVDDIPLILKTEKPAWITVEAGTGRISCDICKLPISIAKLKKHAYHLPVACKDVRGDVREHIDGDARETLVRGNFDQRVTVATAASTASGATAESARDVNRVKNDGTRNAIEPYDDAANRRRNNNANLGKRSDVAYLFETIVTADCHEQFYCLSCFCRINGERNVFQHVRGGNHLSRFEIAGSDLKSTKERLCRFFSWYKFRKVTVDDLRLISESKKAKWLTVKAGTNQLLCNICKLPLGLSDPKQRPEHSSTATDKAVEVECNDIRMVGADHYYCFRCSCPLSPVRNAIKHAVRAGHVSSKFADCQVAAKNYKFKSVTEEQLKWMVNREVKFFSIDPSNGRIYCVVCRCDINITRLKSHANNPVHQRAKICQQLCKNVYRKAESNDRFRCSLCVLEISSLNNARQHVLSSDHMLHFYPSNQIQKKRNEYMSLWDHFDFK